MDVHEWRPPLPEPREARKLVEIAKKNRRLISKHLNDIMPNDLNKTFMYVIALYVIV